MRFSGELATTSASRWNGNSDWDFRSTIGMHTGHIESTPQNRAELRDSKYAEYWTRRAMKSELEGRTVLGTFSDENIP